MKDVSVFKIDSSLIKKIKSVIKKYPIKYQSIKQFIEITVSEKIEKLRGNIK